MSSRPSVGVGLQYYVEKYGNMASVYLLPLLVEISRHLAGPGDGRAN